MPGRFHVASDRTDTIQVLRLAHALSETSWQLHVPDEHADRYAFLATHFPLAYSVRIAES